MLGGRPIDAYRAEFKRQDQVYFLEFYKGGRYDPPSLSIAVMRSCPRVLRFYKRKVRKARRTAQEAGEKFHIDDPDFTAAVGWEIGDKKLAQRLLEDAGSRRTILRLLDHFSRINCEEDSCSLMQEPCMTFDSFKDIVQSGRLADILKDFESLWKELPPSTSAKPKEYKLAGPGWLAILVLPLVAFSAFYLMTVSTQWFLIFMALILCCIVGLAGWTHRK